MIWRVLVAFADGDSWNRRNLFSTVEVEADRELDARLVAEQMVHTPMPGKPDHIQIVGTLTRSALV